MLALVYSNICMTLYISVIPSSNMGPDLCPAYIENCNLNLQNFPYGCSMGVTLFPKTPMRLECNYDLRIL